MTANQKAQSGLVRPRWKNAFRVIGGPGHGCCNESARSACFLLIPIKIYTGWVAKSKVPEIPLLSRKLHFNATIDILLLLFFSVTPDFMDCG